MRNLLLLLTLVFAAQIVSAQEECGFDIVHRRLMNSDSAYARSVRAFSAKWAQSQGSSNQSVISNGYASEYEIPVVVHVIHTGGAVGTAYNPNDATINAALLYLNETYAASYSSYPDSNNGGVWFPVKFVLAKRTETCGSTSGIVRVDGSTLTNYSTNGMNLNNSTGASETAVKALSKWNNGDYYNIWIVNKIDGHDGTTSGSFTAGFAYFPGAGASIDGTVVLASRFTAGTSTLPHEIGHAFNLHHTFNDDNGGASCPPNTNCASDGDEVCDTDPHIRNSGACPANSATNACTSTTWAANQTQRNIMDYSTCRDRFTAGQRTRWLTALTGPRSGLASSLGAVAPPSTTTASASCSTTINSGITQGSTNMGPTQIVLNDMTSSSRGFQGDGDTSYVDRTCEQWATITQGKTYTLSVKTETNAQDVQVYIDYNGNGTFVAGEKVFDHNTALSSNGDETHSTNYTVPTSGINTCGPLRMRVVADWQASSHISNGCGQLDYGQAEDVTVYVKKENDTVTMYNTITSGSNPTCSAGSVTFTASASKSLTGVSYQWYRNSQAVGSNSSTYSVSSLSAGTYYVKCKVRYTNECSVTDSMLTNEIGLLVNSSSVTPSVVISANPGNTICTGTSVTFTAVPTNGGTTPAYQWKVNGSNVGTNSTTYTTSSLTNGQAVTCVMTSNATCASPTTATSNAINMSVTGTVSPSVSISANPGTSICAGASVTFTATPTNGGTTPTYQWKVNGSNVGTNSNMYTTSSLTNGQTVTCVMTSNNSCASPSTATSNGLVMTVTATVTPSVSIAASPSGTICAGTSVTFTPSPVNGGAGPTYQWKVNGSNVTTGSTYTTSSLTNGQTVSCVMTSNATCPSPATATSNNVVMAVTSSVTPSVTIAASPSGAICSGTSVTFTPSPTNGGTTPSYQWKVNGNNVATGSTYTTTTLTNGQTVSCVMTSNAACPSPVTATSNNVVMSVSSSVTPSVTISSGSGTSICTGGSVTFTAVPTNGGTTPAYQWKVNGSNVGTNSNTYTTTSLTNGQTVTCVMTSNNSCASPTTATSNALSMSVTSSVTPSVTISSGSGTSICSGSSVTFTAVPTNGGSTPAYQWKVNGTNAGTNSSVFTTTALSNGDAVSCVMTSIASCASPTTATSNTINMTVGGTITPSVSITSGSGTTICTGAGVTFTASPTNGGSAPSYQWKVNGSNVGTNSNMFTTTALTNGQAVSCVMTSNASCASPATGTSNSINMTVVTSVTPSVAIASNPGSAICSGTAVTFTATPTNGGTTPAYQWKVNGSNAGTNSSTFTSSTLSNNDIVTCVLTSSISCVTSATVTSNAITMTVNSLSTPAISISVAPNDTVCAGTTVTYTATPTNGGTAPRYQWKLNNVLIGPNSPTYVLANPSNGDIMSCELTSNAACVTSILANSSNITLAVTQNVTPTISIAANPGNTICNGTTVAFTASITNGGTTPVYQWKVNGTNVGANSATYSSATLSNNDVVACVLASSIQCVSSSSVTSNAVTMTVNSLLTPSVTTTVNPGTTICSGATATFTATPGNGGTSPTYQWKKNGTNITGATSSTYNTNTLANGDVVTVVMTSSNPCLATTTATSTGITMTVNTNLTPDISISATPNTTICVGTQVSFSATPANGGTAPAYQWRVNGNNVGSNSNSFASSTLANGDIVDCILTSNATCVTKPMDTSNSITMSVIQFVTPSVSISSNIGTTTCNGGEVAFSSSFLSGGTAQAYQWRLNGSNIAGATGANYTTNALSNGDILSLRMNITSNCPNPDSAISNAISMNVITPSLTLQVTPGDTICDDQAAMFNLTSTNAGSQPLYQWHVNGVDIFGANSTMFNMSSVNHGDVITASYISSSTCINAPKVQSTNSISMVVHPTAAPAVYITANPGEVFTSGDIIWFNSSITVPNVNYQWRKNGIDIPGATGYIYTEINPQDGDSISLWVKSDDICRKPDTAISNIIVLRSNTSVPAITEVFHGITIAPNPNAGKFILSGKLNLQSTSDVINIDVLNTLGAVVYKGTINIEHGTFKGDIDLGDIADGGLFMARLQAEGSTHYVKFIIAR